VTKKEFHSAFANELPNGWAPVDGNELISVASQAMSFITSRRSHQKAWHFTTVMRHPKMNEGAAWLLDAIYFQATAYYPVGPGNESISMICGADITRAGVNDERTLFYTAFTDSLLWHHRDAEELASQTMENIDLLLTQRFGQPTWYMVEGTWRFGFPFSRRALPRPSSY